MFYTRVDFLSYEIRLLNIQEASDDDELCCTLETTTLIEPGNYYALSYCWGDQRRQKKIVINNSVVEVGDNLEAALRQLRSCGFIRIWIDALCINRSNEDEKGLQLCNMRRIYSQDLYVIIWLGDDPDNTANAVKYLFENKRYMWFPGRRYTTVDGMTSNARLSTTGMEEEWDSQRWRIFQDFFDLTYWRRTWVIQEVASSAQVKVLFGREALEWRRITEFLLSEKSTQARFQWPVHHINMPPNLTTFGFATKTCGQSAYSRRSNGVNMRLRPINEIRSTLCLVLHLMGHGLSECQIC